MLSIEENEILTRVGAGTPMGELLRRYWHPVCAADELAKSPFRTKEVMLMGEELVVYKDRSGQLGIVDKYCAHRRASLAYGVVEEHGIRCQYHGWKFDETGRCIEQPFEDTTHPEDRFRDKCSIKAYKVEELGGLIFAYLGPAPAPLLPRWGPLVWEDAVRDIAIADLPCNWLQCQENSLDPVHTEWLHGYAGTYFKQLKAQQPITWDHRQIHQKIGFDAFKHGIIKRRVSLGNDETHDEWKVGHSILFPEILLVGNPLSNTMQFRVPVDDTKTLHISLYTWKGAPGAEVPKQELVPSRKVPLYDEKGYLIVDIQFNQDYMAWITQGDIAKRNLEKLGESDKGIILFRKMLMQQMEIVRDGADPTINYFLSEEENAQLEPPNIPLEPSRFGRGTEYVPQEAGYSKDGDKINAVMQTWQQHDREKLLEHARQ
jgi:5,5'-dehydrodivanillate O-demethylase